MIQLIAPNPNIQCKPGWCLAYVNQAFGVPIRYGSATAAWNGSATKHRDWDFPEGVWVPVWFSLATEPNGHVALRAPDGSVYSTTHPTATTPTHHPDMADLFRAYARYNPLTYLGWTEDVEDTPVVTPGTISLQSETITPLEDELSAGDVAAIIDAVQKMHDVTRDYIPGATLDKPVPYKDPVTGKETGQTTSLATLAGFADFQATATRSLVKQGPAAIALQINAAGIAEAVRDELVKLIGGAK